MAANVRLHNASCVIASFSVHQEHPKQLSDGSAHASNKWFFWLLQQLLCLLGQIQLDSKSLEEVNFSMSGSQGGGRGRHWAQHGRNGRLLTCSDSNPRAGGPGWQTINHRIHGNASQLEISACHEDTGGLSALPVLTLLVWTSAIIGGHPEDALLCYCCQM